MYRRTWPSRPPAAVRELGVEGLIRRRWRAYCGLMRRRWMFALLVVGAAASIGSYAFARSMPRASGWTSYAPLAPPSVGIAPSTRAGLVVPRVTNVDLGAAYARLHRAGLRVSFPSSFSAGSLYCLPPIAQQSPRPGRRVRKGAVVTLRAKPPRCGVSSPGVPTGRLPSAKVPDFADQSVSAAVAWAESHRLYWEVDQLPPLVAGSAPGLLGNYRVTSQRPPADSVLALGIGTGGGNQGSFQPTPLTLRGKSAKPAKPLWCPNNGAGSFDVRSVRSVLGLPRGQAEAKLTQHGCSSRVVEINGHGQTVTADLKLGRVDLSLVHKIVTAVNLG
jgi:hypothetical protein